MKKITTILLFIVFNISFAQDDVIQRKQIAFKQIFVVGEFDFGAYEMNNTVNYNNSIIQLGEYNLISSIGLGLGYRTTFNSYVMTGFSVKNAIQYTGLKTIGENFVNPTNFSIPLSFTYTFSRLNATSIKKGPSGLSITAGLNYNLKNQFYGLNLEETFKDNDDVTWKEKNDTIELASLTGSNIGGTIKIGITSRAFSFYAQAYNDITNFIDEVEYKRLTFSLGLQYSIFGSKSL